MTPRWRHAPTNETILYFFAGIGIIPVIVRAIGIGTAIFSWPVASPALARTAPQRIGAPSRLSWRNLERRLRPYDSQRSASASFLRLLRNRAHTRRLLRNGVFLRQGNTYQVQTIVRRKPTEEAILFRIGINDEHGTKAQLFFKPRQKKYADWATEIAICQLAEYLQVRVAPCTARIIPEKILTRAITGLSRAERERLRWTSQPNGRRALFGFVSLWAPAYVDHFGRFSSMKASLSRLAPLMNITNRRRILDHPLLREFPALLTLDFLTYNNDRRNNLGTIRTGPNALILYPIDFGDGLSGNPLRKVFFRTLFAAIALFPKRMIAKIEALDAQTLAQLFRHPRYGPLVPQATLSHVMRQRREILEQVRRIRARDGEGVLF